MTLEEKLDRLSGFTRPEDLADTEGKKRTLSERLDLAQAREAATKPPVNLPTAPVAVGDRTAAIESLSMQLDAERVALRSAASRCAALESQLAVANASLADVEQAKAELEEAFSAYNQEEALAQLTIERDHHQQASEKALKNLGMLEKMCGVMGVDPAAAVRADNSGGFGGGGSFLDQFLNATGAVKSRLWREHKADIRAEADRRQAATADAAKTTDERKW